MYSTAIQKSLHVLYVVYPYIAGTGRMGLTGSTRCAERQGHVAARPLGRAPAGAS